MRRFLNMFRPDVLALYKKIMISIAEDPYQWYHCKQGKTLNMHDQGVQISLKLFSLYHRKRLSRQLVWSHGKHSAVTPPKCEHVKAFIEGTHLRLDTPGWPLKQGAMYTAVGDIAAMGPSGAHVLIPTGENIVVLEHTDKRGFKILHKSQSYELYISGTDCELLLKLAENK